MLAGCERARALIDLDAVSHNVARLKDGLAADALLCAVVKANGYGHGAVPAAAAALRGGADWLGVATVDEAEEVRAAGFTVPLLIFGPLTGAELLRAVAAGADVTVWSAPFLAAARKLGARMHVKFNSGMGRLGVDAATALVLAAGAAAPGRLIGLMSHFATAEEDDPAFFMTQLDRFTALEAELKRLYPGIIAHAANSAATLRDPGAHRDMVRTGIAIYGLSPFNTDPFADDLEPAMRLSSYVAGIREVQAGESVGYGRRFVADGPARLAIVPIGYADGIRRALTNRGDVLIAGRRCRIAGTISMDQLTVLLPKGHGRPGDEVVFIGSSGSERLLAEEMARLLETINYEVVCDVSPRVARRYVGAPS
jgi:alanine racemase